MRFINRHPLLRRSIPVVVAWAVMTTSIGSGVALLDSSSADAATGTHLVASFLNNQGVPVSDVNLPVGHVSGMYLEIRNQGPASTGTDADPTLTLQIPKNLTLSVVQELGGSGISDASAAWSCTGSGVVHCHLHGASNAIAVLAPGATAVVALGVSPTAASSSHDRVSATVSMSRAVSASTSAGVLATTGSGSGLDVSATIPHNVGAGTISVVTYQVYNSSSTSAVAGANGVAAVSIQNPLPPNVVSAWRLRSSGWTCTGAPTAEPTCSLTQSSLDPGTSSPPLAIAYFTKPGLAARSLAEQAGTPVNWNVGISEYTTASGLVSGTQPASITLLPRTAGHLTVTAQALSSSVIMGGSSTMIEIKNQSVDGFPAGLTDTVTLPSGLTTTGTSAGGWACPAGGGTVVCTHSDSVSAGSNPSFDLSIAAAASVSSGPKLIKVVAAATNGESQSTTRIPLFVIQVGGPRLSLVRVSDSTTATPVTTGAPISSVIGQDSPFTYVITNTGNQAFAKGDTFTLTLSLTAAAKALIATYRAAHPSATPALGMKAAAKGCVVNTTKATVTCTFSLAKSLAAGASSAPLSFSARVNHALDESALKSLTGAQKLEIGGGRLATLTVSVRGDPRTVAPTNIGVDFAIQRPAMPDLAAIIAVPAPLQVGGGSNVATVTVQNLGAATRVPASVTFTLPSSVSATAVAGSSCSVSGVYPATQRVTCSAALVPGGSISAPGLASAGTVLLTDVSTTNDVQLSTQTTVGGSSTTSSVTLPVNPIALVALQAPTAVAIQTLSSPTSLEVLYSPSSNAPAGEHYSATLCTDAAMTQNCRTVDVTTNAVVNGLTAATTYYVTVTATASAGFTEATSIVASGTTAVASGLVRMYGTVASRVSHAMRGHALTPTAPVPPATGSSFCDLVDSLTTTPASTLSANLGDGIAVALSGVTISGSSCDSATTISFTGGSMNAFGYYTLSTGAGTITASGVSLNSVTMSTPEWWGPGSALSLHSSQVTLPFTGSEGSSSVLLQGSFSTNSLFGLPLPSGWSASTTVNFSSAAGIQSIAVASAGGPNGTGLSIDGSVSTDGSFAVNVVGTLSLDGVSVSDLNVSWASGHAFVGTGTISMGGSTVTIGLRYTDAADWTFSPSGSISVFGQSVAGSGSVSDDAGTISGNIDVTISTTLGGGIAASFAMAWNPADGSAMTGSGSVTFSGQGSMSASLSYVSESEYAVSASVSNFALTSSISVTAASASITQTPESFACTLAGTLAIGSGSLAIDGSYSDSANWTITGSASSLKLSSSISLTQATGTVTDSSGVITATFNGTLAIGSGSLGVSGTYNAANDWSVTLSTGTLTITSGISLTSATATITEVPTGSSTSDGTVTASFGGTLAIGGGSVSVSGVYLASNNWSIVGSVSSLGLTSGIALTSATATVCDSPTSSVSGLASSCTAPGVNGGVTANFAGTFTIWGVTTSASGVINSSTGEDSFTIAVTSPITVVTGLVITGFSATWDTMTGLTGNAKISLGSAAVAISVTYASGSSWSFTVSVGSTGSLSLSPQISVSAASFVGTISDTSGVVTWAMYATLGSITLVPGFLTLTSSTLSITSTCPTLNGSVLCPTGSNTTYLGLAATLAIQLGTGQSDANQTVSVAGVYGVQSGGFIFQATMGTFTIVPGFLSITKGSLTISYGDSQSVNTGSVALPTGAGSVSGYTISVAGSIALNLPGDNMTVPVTFTYLGSASNFNFVSDLPAGGTLGSTGAALSSLAFSSMPETISLGGLMESIPANTLVLGGSLGLPSWLATYLGFTVPQVDLYATYTSSTVYSVSAVFPETFPMSTGSSDFTISLGDFMLTLSQNGENFTQGVSVSGTMTTSGSAGDSSFNVQVGLSYSDLNETISGYIQAEGQNCTIGVIQGGSEPSNCQALWANAFGLSGLDIQTVSIQVTIELLSDPIPLPGLGLTANMVLTGPLLNDLGAQSNVPIMAALNLSVANPCIDVQIGTPGANQPNVINIGGVISASYADLVVAPDGCTIGTAVIAPGVGYAFTGAFFGVSVSFSSYITTSPTIEYTATLDVGPFNIQNFVEFQGASVYVNFTPTSLSVVFSGSATIVGVTISLSGSVGYNSTAGTSWMSLNGSLSNFNVYGISITNASFSAAYNQGPGSALSFSLSCTGDINILGNSIDVNQMTFSYANGQVQTIYLNVSANINVSNVANIDGNFTFQASESSGTFSLTATGTVSIPAAGFSMTIAACPNGAPGLSITTVGFNLCSATLSESFFTATLSGQMWWGTPPAGTMIMSSTGTAVAATQGDFYFSVSNVSIGIAGFGVTGSVALGYVNSIFWAQIQTSISLSNTSSDAPISISGSFTSTGDFSFTGTGNVSLAGISLKMSVNASAVGSAVSVSGSTTLNIAGAQVSLSGTFSSVPGGVSVTMVATASLTISGFSLGSATVSLQVIPGTELVSISDTMSLGGIFTATLNGTVGALHGTAVFYFSINTGISIPGVSVSGGLVLTNCTSSACTATQAMTAQVTGQFKDSLGTAYSFATSVNPNWSFTVSASGSTNSCTGVTNTGLVRYQSCFAGSYFVALSTASPYLSFSLQFQASVQASDLKIVTSCRGKWYNPRTWKCDTTSSWGNWFNLVSVGASVDSGGNISANYDGVKFRMKI